MCHPECGIFSPTDGDSLTFPRGTPRRPSGASDVREGAGEVIGIRETSNQRIAETHALEPAEIQIHGVDFGIQTEGDGGDLRIRG